MARTLILPDGTIDAKDRRIIAGVYPIASAPESAISIYSAVPIILARRKTDRSTANRMEVAKSTIVYINGVKQ